MTTDDIAEAEDARESAEALAPATLDRDPVRRRLATSGNFLTVLAGISVVATKAVVVRVLWGKRLF